MTTADMQHILKAIADLDQFAASTPLPRPWHAQWQAAYQQVVAKVQAIAAKHDPSLDEIAEKLIENSEPPP